jgi:replication initiation protein RepC
MAERLATTPFGGAPLRAKNFARMTKVEGQQKRLRDGDAGNETGTAEKWQLIRALTEARDVYGLSDRSIAVLEALLSFHPERQLDGRAPIIVFPSNAELSLRCRGMSAATLRRHLAALVDAGLIFRRDSPNGKRFCQRDERGIVENAFGFDLAPLVLASDEIAAHAEAARDLARRISRVRAEISLHLRDIAKTIEAALSEARRGDWPDFVLRLQSLSGRVARNGELSDHLARASDLLRLRAEVEKAYLDSLSEEEMSGNELVSERHIQNSNTDPSFEKDGKRLNEGAEPAASAKNAVSAAGDNGMIDGDKAVSPRLERKSVGIGLKQFLACCPQIVDYARDGIRSWKDVVAAAELIRSMLGVSPSAWAEARAAMGEIEAAITLSAIFERAEAIRSPGGYLRDLTRKAEAGRFSVRPMLKALE